MSVVQRWWRLPARERIAVIEAAILLATVPLGIRIAGLRRAVNSATHARVTASSAYWSVPRVSQLVDAVASELPWRTTCLHRALVTASLLSRRSLASEITIGVRRDHRGFAAHAWIVGAPDSTGGESYAPLATWPVSARPAPR